MKKTFTPEGHSVVTPDPIEAVKVAAAEQIAPRPVRRWRARAFQAYLVFATVAFVVLVVLANRFDYFAIDLSVTRAVQTIHLPLFASLMWAISFIGYSPQMGVLIAAAVVLLFVVGLRWESVVVLAVAVGSTGLSLLIKTLVHRPRPNADLVTVFQQLDSYSFPSGHVLTYLAFFGFLFFLSYCLLKSSWMRAALLVVSGGLIALVGISRIYLGDHWASDVIGAYLLGSLWLVLWVTIYRWGKPRFFV